MKTITITPDDALELRLLADRLEREWLNARKFTESHQTTNTGGCQSDDERAASHAVETLRRVLRNAKEAR